MENANFIDYIRVFCKSGDGGAGCVHFHRDKRTRKGGPDGGDGGRGGHIILKGNQNLWSLLHLKFKKHFIAENGKPGSSALKAGADGKDVVIEVPLGTIVKDSETNEIILEITRHGEERILLEGGRGGLGNNYFKSSTNQTPRYAQPGEPGKKGWKIFELKILADVGIVGFPNAGKSTLLSVITAAKPKIADYPFTTLTPNLGIVKYKDFRSFVVADIPGIIENAHKGKGIGLRFLRHIESNSILLFLLPAHSPNVINEYQILLNEFKAYNPELLDKKRVIAISKSDLINDKMMKKISDELKNNLPDIPFIFISSHHRKNLEELKDLLWKELNPSTNTEFYTNLRMTIK